MGFVIMNSSFFILFFLHLFCLPFFTLPFAVSTEIVCIPSEAEALLKLKHYLNDSSNTLSSWNSSAISNCCLWPAVVCNNVTAHVLQLHLNSSFEWTCAVNGTISSLFAENLDWLSSLSKLEYLDLGGIDLSKSFDWLHTLQALPSLTDLHLSLCTLPPYSQPSLLNFSSLLTLDLSITSYSSAISSIPRWIFGLRKLVSLQFRGNNIQGPIPHGIQNLTLLQNLDLSFNSLSSSIPDWLYGLHHLNFLNLEYNKLNGTISDALGNLTSLVELHLSNNQFSENPFESLRSLSKLSSLEIGDNHFEGVVKEDHLANLTSLKVFYASGNNFTLKVGPNWLPTFQLTGLDMSSWQLGPNFPSWIQSQNKLEVIVMSNTGILDPIPTWFWEAFSQASYVNLSHNNIHGELVTTLRNPISIRSVDLSTNHLCGKLPYLSNYVIWLDLSSNSFLESMDDFLCKKQDKPMNLEFLNLASNNLSGEIPDCWMIWPFLMDVNLQSNHFVGNLPPSMASLAELQSLQIRNNSLSGIFPTILKKTDQLICLDLGENNLSGTIPAWVGA
ncbi:putative inactive leucine-rich repeat receptor-like protein kinase, partial [Mucuna pruriens]